MTLGLYVYAILLKIVQVIWENIVEFVKKALMMYGQ